MALIKCKECGNDVSTTASACPKCGAKVRKKTSVFTWILCLFAVMIVIGALSGQRERRRQDDAQHQQAVETARRQQAQQEAAQKALAALTPEQRAELEKKQAEERAAQERQQRQLQGIAWNYRDHADKMTNKTTRLAEVKSLNEFEFDFPYRGAQRATLQLRAHPRFGNDVILQIEKGQFHCGYDDCDVSVRFGNGKPQRYSATEPSDNSSDTLFIGNYARFLANLRKVDAVYIEAAFFHEGNRVLEFDVRDLEWK